MALAALRHPDLPVAELDGPTRQVKLLVDHRRDAVHASMPRRVALGGQSNRSVGRADGVCGQAMCVRGSRHVL